MMVDTQLGLDLTSIWQQAKAAGKDFITQLPGEIKKTVVKSATEKVSQVATPIATKVAQEKTQRVISKGNVAAFALGGLALGALVAGGSWQRRAVGGIAVGTVSTLVGFQMGMLYDQL